MTLALRHFDDAPPLPAPYLTVQEVAARLGLGARHVQQQCEAWSADGRARKFDGRWGVHHSVDPARLAEIESDRARDLRQLAALRAAGVRPADIARAEQRRDLVTGFARFDAAARSERERVALYLAHVAACGTGFQPVKCGTGLKTGRAISVSRWYEWRRLYQLPGDAGGLRALCGVQGRKSADSAAVGPAAWEYCRNLILSGNRIRVATAWLLTRGEATKHPGDAAWSWPSLRTIQMRANREIPRPARILADEGPRAFDAQCIPKGQRDYEAIPVGRCWIGDERTLDVMCRVPAARNKWRACRELKFTAWIDERSRYVVGWLLAPFANSNTILAALKKGVKTHGLPETLRVDWGRDFRKAVGHVHTAKWRIDSFDGPRIAGVLDKLGIAVTPATPYMPWAKMIESFFSTVADQFDKTFASYWGGSPDARHEERSAWVKANLDKLPTIEEVAARLAEYLDVYHAAPHGGDGMFGKSPAEALAAFRVDPQRGVADDILEFLFLDFTEPKVVQRDGVRHLNAWYGWGEPRLIAMQGEYVILGIHPDDAGRAWVCDAQRRPLFAVECERWKFSTKRDAERIAKTRGRARRQFAADVSAGRAFRLETSPADQLALRGLGLAYGTGPASSPSPLKGEGRGEGECGTGFQPVSGLPGRAPSEISNLKSSCGAGFQPVSEAPGTLRLVTLDPDLSNALRSARENTSDAGPLADARAAGETVELEDMCDPLYEDAPVLQPSAADEPDDEDWFAEELEP